MNIYILMDWNRYIYVYVMNIIYNSYVCSKLELRYYYFFLCLGVMNTVYLY